MPFWNGRCAYAGNIRLFSGDKGWKRYDDKFDTEGRTTFFGCSREVELALTAALTSSNLVVLTGAGSSFCAKPADGSATAPGMTDLWHAVEAKVTTVVLNKVIGLIPKAKGIGKNIEKLMTLSKLYMSLFDDENSHEIARFIADAETAILERVDFVTPDTALNHHKNIVRKLARRGLRKARTKVFTTNYDLCFETAAREQQFVVIDGFSHAVPQTYDRAHFSYDIVRRTGGAEIPDYIENVFHLYKLHGSLDWRRGTSGIVRSKSASDGEPVLIYPRNTKYQEAFEEPYLDMMAAFQTALREPDTALIISGFGFNDDHIAKPIMAAVEANMTLRVVICDTVFLNDADLELAPDTIPSDASPRVENAYFKRFVALAAQGDPRITLLTGRFEDLEAAVPDIVAQTERERHYDRLRAATVPPARGLL